MRSTGDNAHAVAEVLDTLEKATREVGRSINSMSGALDRERLTRARDGVASALAALDSLLGGVSTG